MRTPGAGRVFEAVARVERALGEPARNLCLFGAIVIGSASLLLVEAVVAATKGWFALVGVPTVLSALSLVYIIARGGDRRADVFGDRSKPDVLSALIYAAGVLVAAGVYGYLALTPYPVKPEDLADWRIWVFDKRPLVFGYVIAAALPAFHYFTTGFFLDRHTAHRPQAAGILPAENWTMRALGAVLIALLAYTWIGLPALRGVMPSDGGLASFYDVHAQVHLAAFEQIRLGAVPFVEAQSQYGIGNQALLYFLVETLGFSNHGFHAVNVALNVVCVVGFFVLLQQVLGFGWALAGLVGWLVLPSPYVVLDFSGWAVLTRWLFIPVIALLLARVLLKEGSGTGPDRRLWAALVVGTLWGIGSFLSQETRSAGILVMVLCVLLFGPASGMSLRSLVRFALVFVASGVVVLVVSVSAIVGASRFLEAFRLSNVKSDLVMAGYANAVWATDLDFSAAFKIVNGLLYPTITSHGDFQPLLAVYGLAILFPIVIGLLTGFLGRRWQGADARERLFVRNFAGVAVGAFVAHMFSLLRSDASHLYGPAFLLPLFLVTLPLFVWRHVDRGPLHSALLLVSLGIVVAAAVTGRGDIVRTIEGSATVWRDTGTAGEVYAELWAYKGQSADLAARYSPIPAYQAPFRRHRDYAEVEELFGLLRDKLRGRPVELTFHTIDELIPHPDAFYFYSGLRSVSGITLDALWLRSEEIAWIDKVVGATNACIFYGPTSRPGIVDAWKDSARSRGTVTTEPIAGTRLFGFLSCRTS